MKPELCKKTGYSLKDTLIMLIKCLVLTMAFLFLSFNINKDKVKSAYISNVGGVTVNENIRRCIY